MGMFLLFYWTHHTTWHLGVVIYALRGVRALRACVEKFHFSAHRATFSRFSCRRHCATTISFNALQPAYHHLISLIVDVPSTHAYKKQNTHTHARARTDVHTTLPQPQPPEGGFFVSPLPFNCAPIVRALRVWVSCATKVTRAHRIMSVLIFSLSPWAQSVVVFFCSSVYSPTTAAQKKKNNCIIIWNAHAMRLRRF